MGPFKYTRNSPSLTPAMTCGCMYLEPANSWKLPHRNSSNTLYQKLTLSISSSSFNISNSCFNLSISRRSSSNWNVLNIHESHVVSILAVRKGKWMEWTYNKQKADSNYHQWCCKNLNLHIKLALSLSYRVNTMAQAAAGMIFTWGGGY